MSRCRYLALIITLTSCKPAQSYSTYAADTEACVQTSKTCDEYVQCMVSAGAKYGIQYRGRCL